MVLEAVSQEGYLIHQPIGQSIAEMLRWVGGTHICAGFLQERNRIIGRTCFQEIQVLGQSIFLVALNLID